MTTKTTTEAPGTVCKAVDAGYAYIQIIKAVGGYTVKVWQGTEQLEGWTVSYTTRAATKAAFDYTIRVFEAYGSAAGIERHRATLIAERDRLSRLPSQRTRCAAIDDELDMLRDLATVALEPRFIADVTNYLAA